MLGMAGSVVAQDNKEQQPCARQELGRRSGNASITVKKTGGLLRPRQRRQSHLLRPLGISGSRPNRKAFSPGQSPTPVLVSRPESPGRYADVPSPIPVAYGPATTKTICLDRSCSWTSPGRSGRFSLAGLLAFLRHSSGYRQSAGCRGQRIWIPGNKDGCHPEFHL